MQKFKFNDRSIAALKAGSYSDELLPGFCIRCGKTRKTFFAIREGRRTTIGHWPSKSLQDARSEARQILAGKYGSKRTTTFFDAYTAYKATYLINYRPYTQYQTFRLFDRHCTSLHRRDLNSLRPTDFTALFVGLRQTEANHLFGVLRTFMNWCERNGYVERSQLAKLSKPYKERTRDRLLTDQEIVAIWKAADTMGAFGVFCQCLILTGQRKAQFANLPAKYITGTTIQWPPEAMKNGTEQTIPITPMLEPYLHRLKPVRSFSKPTEALRKTSGVTDVKLHDFRRYLSSTMRKLHVPIDTTEAILHHLSGSRSQIQRIYDRYDRQPEIEEALRKFQAHLQSLLEGTP